MTAEPELREAGAKGTSPDGRTFFVTMSSDNVFPIGGLVSLMDASSGIHLGQVDTHQLLPDGQLQAGGRLLGVLGAKGLDSGAIRAFRSADVAPADADLIAKLNTGAGANLDVGEIASGPELPARLVPSRMNRHTFWCGQSGSGKTYALGVLLEEVLLHTGLPMVIFDPNADFVRLAEVREDAPAEAADQLRQREIRVLRPRSQPGEDLRVRFTDLELPSKGAVMRLDPLIDRGEYNTLLHIEELLSSRDLGKILPTLRESSDPAHNALALRIENLGLLNWEIWALGLP